MSLAAPFVVIGLLLRVLRGRETWADLAERLGLRRVATVDIWLHGASNGELTSARPLVDALRRMRPDLRFLITANSVTGRDMVRGWQLPGVAAQLAPLDLRSCLSRILAGARPALFLGIESEIWPNRIATLAAKRTPIAMAGARVSDRSAARWPRGLARRVFSRIALLSAQDDASAKRFEALGVPEGAIAPVLNLKAFVAPRNDGNAAPTFDREKTICAGATHPGEEEIVLDAFKKARKERPDLQLILAPRHPRRAEEVAALAAKQGLALARRTLNETPGPSCPIYLADTMGEMRLWHSAASVTFVGGSLVDKGGHTPYEPAACRSAILHGPSVSNFAGPYAALAEAKAAREVSGDEALARAMVELTGSDQAEDMARRAAMVLSASMDQAVLDSLAEALLALLDQGRTQPLR